MGKIIAVVNQKGGVGKTTTSINLAAFLAIKNNKKVLLVDLDPQGNATSGLGLDKNNIEASILDGLLADADFNILRHSTNYKNLDIIPANSDLASAEINLAKMDGRESKLKNYLVNIQQQYDYIIIDCPPSLGLLFVNALTAARYLIITVQTEFYAMEGLGLLIGTIQNIQKNLNPTLSILGVLMTMYDSRTALSQQVKEEIEKVFTGLVFKTVIPRNVKLAEAPSHGLPINVYDRWSKGSKAYKNFTKEVISRVEA
ncbi:ParA family protein [Candidatus Saccharibacteria bacterium]|nr:ParA family protein [Candidatus Saccharibacteria bacterium]MCA9350616.1 ParA family protein [Candidatus Saccharibacteria bacterium]